MKRSILNKTKSRQRNLRSTPPEAVLKLAQQIGDFMAYWGFKKIHGKIWTLSFLSKGPVEAQLFIDSFGVSKALISLAIKDLLHYRVLLQSHPSPKGHNQYVCNPDIAGVIFDILRDRETRMLAEIKLAEELCHEIPQVRLEAANISKDRLHDVAKMISEAQKILRLVIHLQKFDFSNLASALCFDMPLNAEIMQSDQSTNLRTKL